MTQFTESVQDKSDSLFLYGLDKDGLDSLEKFTIAAGFDINTEDAAWFGIGVIIALEDKLPGIDYADSKCIAMREYGRAAACAYRNMMFPAFNHIVYIKESVKDGLLPEDAAMVTVSNSKFTKMSDEIRSLSHK